MGNSASGKRDRAYSSDTDCTPSSPGREDKAFEFGKKNKFLYQPSLEDSDDFPLSLKEGEMRPRASTITSSTNINETALPTVFKWEGGGKDVYISGSFTQWEPLKMVHSQDNFVLILDVPEGEHQYKFLVDGQWQHDPKEPNVDESGGAKKNLINVQKQDFEVFEALAMDSVNSGSGSQKDMAGTPPGEYCQEIPQRNPYDKSAGPPILPPHLLQVILNKDISLSCEPTLLPEPNHVMLNHLYALSIKDGVMVLSATHRYRKKYVTTLLYKPI
ncbi:5'-AMP-activated protein kinase subunit beta-1-like [Limulus polyphemus]|uniref:5'-AMP-activated protein kinase subunit beta-1 n=1 Tax=Limulus polyphemus TaxID=6850 RepID=A0ABM1BBK3_LIMPO|nr:5'-AMP-activated protein kinase subunit beta-1-like [Limulus polyphemus]XP_013778711.1 5'-AMP-activated protein kinase subunit beta-1-like [Limulus polyphemus]XP_013778712.1 5'-AMP-activated protein kinase subunit beta-1-like [Limulus polyphemus]